VQRDEFPGVGHVLQEASADTGPGNRARFSADVASAITAFAATL
jgi:hypothetical protein